MKRRSNEPQSPPGVAEMLRREELEIHNKLTKYAEKLGSHKPVSHTSEATADNLPRTTDGAVPQEAKERPRVKQHSTQMEDAADRLTINLKNIVDFNVIHELVKIIKAICYLILVNANYNFVCKYIIDYHIPSLYLLY